MLRSSGIRSSSTGIHHLVAPAVQPVDRFTASFALRPGVLLAQCRCLRLPADAGYAQGPPCRVASSGSAPGAPLAARVPSCSSLASSPSSSHSALLMCAQLSRSTPALPPFRRTCAQASCRKSSRHSLSLNARPQLRLFLRFSCSTVWSFRTFSDTVRPLSVVMPCFLSVPLSTQGPFAPPALPGPPLLRAYPPPWPARPAPRGVPVAACRSTGRASRVATSFLFHACQRHYPGGNGSVLDARFPTRRRPSP